MPAAYSTDEILAGIKAFDTTSSWISPASAFVEKMTYGDKTATIPGIGVATLKDEKLGEEGEGENIWVVFELYGSLYRLNGFYSSYDGEDWTYGSVVQVKPREITTTIYEAV